ncbi:sulfotransferase family protein [Albidovulum aquaemixtae]|uniref:sulfotransferase family protein n=1 Tax=Albidovulum aquaemixtae TaxID=1542388 RepID=UPI0015E81A83|nr:sulfotransferase [Defluviimonas aquaemixtae]
MVPSHFHNPAGLALRVLRSGNRDALAALFQAGLRLGLAPFDMAIARLVASDADAAEAPSRPVLFVTGPPRSGTTLLHQLLIRALPVAYITNLASLLPRSAASGAFPLTGGIANQRVRLESYYGRTRSLSGPSDGLEFWDRWMGTDRRAIPSSIPESATEDMRRFFARLERQSGRPVLAKNNNLLGSAHLVAAILPTARFVCLRRDPLYLAQSLLKARRDIQGSTKIGYGLDHSASGGAYPDDPIEDVRSQIRFYDGLQEQQMQRLGTDRFAVVSYEELCADPASIVRKIARNVFGFHDIPVELTPLQPRQRQTLDRGTFERLAEQHTINSPESADEQPKSP